MRWSLAAIVLAALSAPLHARAIPTVILEEGKTRYALGHQIEFFEDEQGQLPIEVVSSQAMSRLFQRSRWDVPNFGFKQSAFWFRVRLKNPMPSTQAYILELDNALMDRIDLFVRGENGAFSKKTVGDTFPYGQKTIRHCVFLFPLQLGPMQQIEIYLRIKTRGAAQLPMTLWTPDSLRDHESKTRIADGLFYGFLLVMIIYNLFLFMATRDRSSLLFALYVLAWTAYLGTNDGLLQEYLWPSHPWWANRVMPLSLCCMSLFALHTTMDFLRLKQHLPGWNRVLSWYARAALAGAICSLFVSYNPVTIFGAILVASVSVLIWIVAVLMWRRGYTLARYYVVAWSVLFIGAILISFSRLGIIPRSPLTESAYLIGFALNNVFISIALADRLNQIKREKNQAQADALRIQQRAAETLEQDVQQKTRDLQGKAHELKQAYGRLEEHDRLKSNFFANISHELRTPLTLILTPLQWLLEGKCGPLPELVQDKLRSMVGNTQRLLRLVNQFLDFSRLEYGGMTVSYARVDAKKLAESVVQAFRPVAVDKGLRLELRGQPDLPVVVTDPGKLEKVLANLVSNACKFTDADGKVIVRLATEERWFHISVHDSGVGIREKDLTRIFERFHQVDGGMEGAGIGLALSRELVELCGGTLEVRSEVGLGSIFTVSLPLDTDHVPDLSQIRESPAGEDEHLQAESSAMALAAESGLRQVTTQPEQPEQPEQPGQPEQLASQDQPEMVMISESTDLRALVTEICQREFRVLETSGAEKGLELIKSCRPALVVSDVIMPGMDGNALLAQLRQEPSTRTLPVILLTAEVGGQQRLEGLEQGADDYLVKPFSPRELRARARTLVRLHQQDHELRQLNAQLQKEVMEQASSLERTRMLGKFLPPQVMQQVLEHEETLEDLEGSRRRANMTVFHLQLRGFERVLDEVEPEELAVLLNSYLSEMIEVAFSHGATVDRLVRDLVVGFFGAPHSEGAQQDAVRCARMALQMWEQAVNICNKWREILSCAVPRPTMVLCSGYATVGYFGSSGRLDYTSVGGPVEEAADLLPVVKSGQAVCNQTTWKLIKESGVEHTATEEIALANRERPMKIFRLAGPMEPDMTDEHPARLLSPPARPALISDPAATNEDQSTEPFLPRERLDLEQGTQIMDRYEIAGPLGVGGSAVVYRARDLKLEVDVALKVVHHELKSTPKKLERLYREVRLARLISHPNVASLFDINEWHDHEFISMECIEGQTLADRLALQGRLPEAEGLRILLEVCKGLMAAHTANIVHRDLKPSNIMLGSTGRVVILDFGIAQLASMLKERETESRIQILGTPYYMAPEQFEGKPTDQRTDIYALGVMAYEMFTGQRPFEADNPVALAYQHVRKPPRDPLEICPDLSPRLAVVILCCLEKTPSKRFRHVGEILPLIQGLSA